MKPRYGWRVEFWWIIEQICGSLWFKFCPEDKAAYWLDFLPAWAYVRRKKAEDKWYQKQHAKQT